MVLHPDQEAALAEAADELESALGTGVKVKPAGKGVKVELRFEDVEAALAFARKRG